MISVIVPVYNTEDYLRKCLDSLVNQTWKKTEIIVVNDGSTDNSEKLILEYAQKYTNIKYISQKNQGQAAARNVALQVATGKYVTFVDSDDYIELNMLEEMALIAKKNQSDIVICDITKVENDKTFIFKNYWNVVNEPNRNFMTSHPGPVARLYSKKLLESCNFKFLENVIYEDLATIPLLGMNCHKISYLAKPFYYYVIRAGSSMKQSKYNKKLEDIFIVMDNLKKNMSEEYYNELEYLYIEHLLYSASLRFLKFNRKDMLKKIRIIFKNNYSNYTNNIYYKNKSKKFKIVCFMMYHNMGGILKVFNL